MNRFQCYYTYHVELLINRYKAQQQTNESIFVDIVKVNKREAFDQWKKRSLRNLTNDKTSVALQNEMEKMEHF